MNDWTKFATEVHYQEKKKNPNALFKNSLKKAAKLYKNKSMKNKKSVGGSKLEQLVGAEYSETNSSGTSDKIIMNGGKSRKSKKNYGGSKLEPLVGADYNESNDKIIMNGGKSKKNKKDKKKYSRKNR